MTGTVVLRGGCVLTLGAKTPNLPRADVLIKDGRIVEVGDGVRSRDAEVIDATDTIVMPGFVDAHRHVWRSLFRNSAVSESVEGGWPALADFHDPEDIYASVLVGLLGAIEAGTTTVVDWADIPDGPGFAEAAMQAHADAGIRSIYVAAAPRRADERRGSPISRDLADRRTELMAVAYGSDVAIEPSAAESVAADWAPARELGVRIHVHAGMTPESADAVAGLAAGVLRHDVTLIHCSHLSEADMGAVASSKAGVVLTPSTEMTYGMGAPPIQSLLNHGIEFGLGVDDVAEAPSDIFAPMRATISLQHATFFDLKLAGKAGLPNMMTTRSSIRQATIQGAEAVGLADTVGSLEPGKQADIIMLRTDRPNIVPMNDPIGAVVWGMDTSNIDSVFVAGRAVMTNGVMTADVAKARSLAVVARRRVAEAAGLLADVSKMGDR